MSHIGPYLCIHNDPSLFNSINNCVIQFLGSRKHIICEYNRSGPNLWNFYIHFILHCVPSDIFEVEREANRLVSYIFLGLKEKIVLPFLYDLNGTSLNMCFRFPIDLFRPGAG